MLINARTLLQTGCVALLGALLLLPVQSRAADGATDTRPVNPHAAGGAATPAAPAPAANADAPGNSGESEDNQTKAVLEGDLDFSAVEMLAIQEGGRKKPLQTYVHEKIDQLVGMPMFPFGTTPYLPDKATGKKIYAMDLFLSIWLRTRDWGHTPVILIAHGALLDAIGFPRTEKYFTVDALQKNDKFKALCNAALEKRHGGKDTEVTSLEQEAELVQQRIQILFDIYNGFDTLPLIPHPTEATGTWLTARKLVDSFDASSADKQLYTQEQAKKVGDAFQAFITAYHERQPEKFVTASQELRTTLINLSPSIYPSYDVLEREVNYNALHPFGWAWIFYLGALVAGGLCYKFRSKPVYALILALYAAGLGFHVYGFTLRCLIAGRPPVSNMYESVIWVGFGAVFFGLVFELIYRKRYFMLCGAAAGFFCLLLMDILPVVTANPGEPGFSQELKPLVPVLRNNFWLTVHVLTITLSYAAFLLTAVLGHVTLWRHLVNPAAKTEHRELHQFVYRTMQVGVLLIACGTILGGVWAYYSWGRFWGWDPKETWAFITLMCYLVVLHGRFTGWWGNFGLSFGSVLCFNSVVMAWYGVNFVLGSGLHAYGKGAGGQGFVFTAVALDTIFLAAATIRYVSYQNAIKRGKEEIKLTSGDPIEEVRALETEGEGSLAAK